MSGQFSGKTVAITGAAGGIGQWLCRFFGQEGASIAALDRSDKVHALVDTLGRDGIKATAAVADIARAEEVKTAFAGFGDVHLLINNAGVSRHPTLAATDPGPDGRAYFGPIGVILESRQGIGGEFGVPAYPAARVDHGDAATDEQAEMDCSGRPGQRIGG